MSAMVERIDDLGKPAWIAFMVLAFIFFFPLGLAMLAFLIWSGRMGCRSYAQNGPQQGFWGSGSSHDDSRRSHIERKIAHLQEKLMRWGQPHAARHAGFAPTGNAAFDEYRDSTLKRLEDEAAEFQDFLKRLRAARDKEEFDAYMAKRRDGVSKPTDAPPQQPNG
ncbi:MAG: DUF2852 domain-containing protein [Beijerinckiaceae bacterium]